MADDCRDDRRRCPLTHQPKDSARHRNESLAVRERLEELPERGEIKGREFIGRGRETNLSSLKVTSPKLLIAAGTLEWTALLLFPAVRALASCSVAPAPARGVSVRLLRADTHTTP